METRTKHFRKRDAILTCLRSTDTHPSAEWIYENVRQEIPDISLATVYRNLALFREDGEIISVATVAGQERFDAYKIAIECGFKTRNEIRYMEDDDALEGLDVINLGLGDVLLDTKTGNIYTPNTNSTVNMGGGEPVGEDAEDGTEVVKVDTEN